MITRFIKKHYLGLILALLVCFITALPQVFAIQARGDNFAGIYPTNTDDNLYYLARGKDIQEGHSFLGNPYLYEYKDTSPMQFWLPDYIMAKPLALLGISVPVGYIIYDFFLVFILSFLTYLILFFLTESIFWSLSGTGFLHLGLFLDLFNRAPSPQLIFIFWLLLALFLIKYIQTKKSIFAVFSSIVFGLIFHLYPYYWTFYLALIAIFVFLSLLRNRKFNFKPYLFIVLGALIIAIPYFVSLYKSMQLSYYAESLDRLGMINTHFPSGIKIVFWALVLMVMFGLSYKKNIIFLNPLSLFLASGVLASAICVNQHVITGKNLEFSSHYWLLAVFWFSFLGIFLLQFWFLKYNLWKYKKLTLIIIAVFILIFSFFNIIKVVKGQIVFRDYEIYWQNYAPIFVWLNENTKRESVVFANEDLSQLIPVYTFNNVFNARPANLHFLSGKEVQERFVINNYFNEMNRKFIMDNLRMIWGVHYVDVYGHELSKNKLRKILGLKQKDLKIIPDKVYNEFVLLKDNLLKKDFKSLLGDYRVDYLIWDKNKNPNWKIYDYNGFLEQIYEANNIIIFKIKWKKS